MRLWLSSPWRRNFIPVLLLCHISVSQAGGQHKEENDRPLLRHQPESEPLEQVLAKLTTSVISLKDKLGSIEVDLETRFRKLQEAVEEEKSSVNKLMSHLSLVDQLSSRVSQLDSRFRVDTSVIQRTLNGALNDVQRLSTQFESLDAEGAPRPPTTIREADTERPPRVGSPSLPMETISDQVEKMVARSVASQLTHFYLNLATKIDSTLGQLEGAIVTRLRRIETTGKKSLSEIEDGRQDLSHVTHLQRSLLTQVQKVNPRHGGWKPFGGCDQNVPGDLKDLLRQVQENVTYNVFEAFKLAATAKEHKDSGPASRADDNTSIRDKGGVAQPADIWRGVFPSTGLSSPSPSASPGPKTCLDSAASATLEEVKHLLRSLMVKGEDLKRTVSREAAEGVDLLKLLHQRFSVLLRRMNTDPGHGEALLAEVRELEHLVENSYSAMLLAQNVFIDSCRRVRSPLVEDRTFEVLNKIVTNIDLGQRFHRKQLDEIRRLIETALSEDERDAAQQPLLHFPLFRQRLLRTTAALNATEQKLLSAEARISATEATLATLSWNSSGNKKTIVVKDVIDQLLTGAKDLKGHSRSQIKAVRRLRNDLQEISSALLQRIAPNGKEASERKLVSPEEWDDKFCLQSLVHRLNVTSIGDLLLNVTSIGDLLPNASSSDFSNRVLQLALSGLAETDVPDGSTPALEEDSGSLQNVFFNDIANEMLMDDYLSWTLPVGSGFKSQGATVVEPEYNDPE